jgi:D-alanyl-D-alanine carboxypeptidase/D-alanyl-D-alanine-endopeptidase (penicillin-binding protein 4)
VPASTGKLYAGALALDTFGADYRIPTTLLANAKPVRDGTLHGDLILYGYGDPTLGTPANPRWADDLASAARKAGIRKVDGDLVADTTRFATPPWGGGWEAGDLQSWFAVPASALSVGENVVGMLVRPGEQVGMPARLRFDPETFAPAFDVENGLRTVAPPARSDVNLVRRPGERTLSVFGRVSLRAAESRFRIALPDPALMAGYVLRRALGDQGIVVTGRLRSVSWPQVDAARERDGLWRVAEAWSPPLAEILRHGFKVSQNLYLQNLLLLVGAHEAERVREANAADAEPEFRTTEQLGLAALRRYLARIGIAADEVEMSDGAGLSRRNLTTAAAFVRLLLANADGAATLAFRSALPEAGVDGTLATRLRNTPAQGRVFAKTGAMSHVVSLAGYATTAGGERIAFALILNNYIREAGSSRMSAELDEIVRMLVEAPVAADTSRPAR